MWGKHTNISSLLMRLIKKKLWSSRLSYIRIALHTKGWLKLKNQVFGNNYCWTWTFGNLILLDFYLFFFFKVCCTSSNTLSFLPLCYVLKKTVEIIYTKQHLTMFGFLASYSNQGCIHKSFWLTIRAMWCLSRAEMGTSSLRILSWVALKASK